MAVGVDVALLGLVGLAGWLGWRQGLPAWAPFAIGFCVGVILLQDPATRLQAWAAAQMSEGVPAPSHAYVLRVAALAQFMVRLGGAAAVGTACRAAASPRRALWRGALADQPLHAISKAAAALDAAVVTAVLACATAALIAVISMSGPLAAAVFHTSVIAPVSGFLELGPR